MKKMILNSSKRILVKVNVFPIRNVGKLSDYLNVVLNNTIKGIII
tara:strand:- start:4884 stop:5018 length:135 start_codon:yes stop_codon:yes gene_type:complete